MESHIRAWGGSRKSGASRTRARLMGFAAPVAAMIAVAGAQPARAQACDAVNDIAFVNGKVLTVDAKDSIASAVRVIGNKIVRVGPDAGSLTPCTQVIDLGGRTVIPGLIDAHTHLVVMSTWPGVQMMSVENVGTIASLQAVIAHEASLAPKGKWLSALGVWLTTQFAEKRFPTLAELDKAAPNNPVLLYENVGGAAESYGPAQTNSAGIRILRTLGVAVQDDGRLVDATGGNTFNQAFNALQELNRPADERQSLQGIMRFMVRFGLTGWHDMHAGTNGNKNFRRFSFLDRLHGYDQLTELWRQGGMSVRSVMFVSNADRHGLESVAQMRAYFGEYDLEGQDLDRLKVRLDNMQQSSGDDWLKLGGQGEHIVHYPWSGPILPTYEKAVRMLAERGWTHEEHSLDSVQTTEQLDAWEKVNKDIPIRNLHWSLAHVPQLSERNAERLAAMGAGATTTSMSYTNVIRGRVEPKPSGPMYRMMLDKGVHVGAGTDTFLGHFNPWHNIYFMTTGLAINGAPVNTAQKISRLEALRIYTMGSAWHSADDAKLGSLETGKLADLAVLSDDYLNVSDHQVRKIRSLLTMVDGKIMFADPAFLSCRGHRGDGIWVTTRTGPACVPQKSRNPAQPANALQK